ncbi:hypothetical protein OK016_26695 [Vibrio chagasii]|nr:hypothetical protein [Vibrio chagasii]
MDAFNTGQIAILPIFAAVMAAFSYGNVFNYTKTAPKVEAFNNAHGSMGSVNRGSCVFCANSRQSDLNDYHISVIL